MTRPTPQTPASDTPPSGAGHTPARADGPPLPGQPWRAQSPAAAPPSLPAAAGPAPAVAPETRAAAEHDPAGYSGADWRKAAREAQSKQYAAQRGDKGRRRRAAGKTTGTGYVPGGNRREPGERS